LFLDFTGDESIPVLPQECFASENEYEQWLCLEPYFKALVRKTSARYAISELKGLSYNPLFPLEAEQNRAIVDNCHFLAHYIGEAVLEKYDFDVGKAFTSCEFGCSEGCFHGVMAGHIRREADPNVVLSEIGILCDTVPVRMPNVPGTRVEDEEDFKAQCAHGIGHGLAAHGFMSIPEASEACQRLNNEYYERKCEDGVMMEHVERYLTLEESKLKEILPEICAPFKDLSGGVENKYKKCQEKALYWSSTVWNRARMHKE